MPRVGSSKMKKPRPGVEPFADRRPSAGCRRSGTSTSRARRRRRDAQPLDQRRRRRARPCAAGTSRLGNSVRRPATSRLSCTDRMSASPSRLAVLRERGRRRRARRPRARRRAAVPCDADVARGRRGRRRRSRAPARCVRRPTRPARPTISPARTSSVGSAHAVVGVQVLHLEHDVARLLAEPLRGRSSSPARPTIRRTSSSTRRLRRRAATRRCRPSRSTVIRSPISKISCSRCEM